MTKKYLGTNGLAKLLEFLGNQFTDAATYIAQLETRIDSVEGRTGDTFTVSTYATPPANIPPGASGIIAENVMAFNAKAGDTFIFHRYDPMGNPESTRQLSIIFVPTLSQSSATNTWLYWGIDPEEGTIYCFGYAVGGQGVYATQSLGYQEWFDDVKPYELKDEMLDIETLLQYPIGSKFLYDEPTVGEIEIKLRGWQVFDYYNLMGVSKRDPVWLPVLGAICSSDSNVAYVLFNGDNGLMQIQQLPAIDTCLYPF